MAKKQVSEKDAVRWVAEALGLATVKESHAPSSMAWAMYKDVKDGEFSKTEFWNLWAKLLPTKAQLEREDEAADTNEKIGDLIDELLRKVSDAEDIDVEPTAPQEDFAAWGFKRDGGEEDKEIV